MKHPVSIVPYANMAPFRAAGVPGGCRFVDLDPRRSTGALRAGEILAAPLPVGDLPVVEDLVEYVGEYGVSAAGAVHSVLLLSDLPFERLLVPEKVFLTEQSSSSVRLLYLLLGHRNGLDRLPYRTSMIDGSVAELRIGDEALLCARNRTRKYVTDLAEEWHAAHRLPFVFARWVVRKDAPGECKDALEAWLSDFASREDEFVRACARPEGRRLGIPEEEMLSYLRNMKRVLGPEELEGQALFLEELRRHGRSPLFRTAEEVPV